MFKVDLWSGWSNSFCPCWSCLIYLQVVFLPFVVQHFCHPSKKNRSSHAWLIHVSHCLVNRPFGVCSFFFFPACLINLRHSYFEDWALSTCSGNSSMKTEIGSLGCWQANSGHYCKPQGQGAFQQQNRISGAFISRFKQVSLNLSDAFLVVWEPELIYFVQNLKDTEIGEEEDLWTLERLWSNSRSLHPNKPPSNLLADKNHLMVL